VTSRLKPWLFAVMTVTLAAASAIPAGSRLAVADTAAGERPLPPPVEVRPEPEGVTLGDPAFEPVLEARADFGRLGGAVYQVEVPKKWNGKLLLFMHGFEDLRPEAEVGPPDFRRYLIAQGIAWGASSFSSTSLIPGRAADETAALWDYFARTYGRPTRTYINGFSMGGMATHIAAERYPDRFDGALGLCGAAGQTPAAVSGGADYFAAGAYAAGVTQQEFDATTDIGALIGDRILPALKEPPAHKRFEDIMVDLTGGPRRFAREGFRHDEETNWRRIRISVSARLVSNIDTNYRLGPRSGVTSEEFNRAVVRVRPNDELVRTFVEGNETTGNLQMPLLTLHTTGDGQVPIEQARILRRRVDAAGKSDQLVQRVIRDPGHCGFRTNELVAGLEALEDWVEHGVKPEGSNVLVKDLRKLDGRFELSPRGGTPAANEVPGARERAGLSGHLTLDGAPFDANFLGAIVQRNGLITPCQYTLPEVQDGRYEITVLADAEARGCGANGARIVLWTFVDGTRYYSNEALPWPRNGRTTATFDATFSNAAPDGVAPSAVQFVGEVYDRRGRNMPPGTRVEAFVGNTRCGIASIRRTGSFAGYLLAVAGPESIAGCERGAQLTFRINGRPAVDTSVNEETRRESLDLTLR
jgi:pimeloyl-ACP methyl ester carboxylesterase